MIYCGQARVMSCNLRSNLHRHQRLKHADKLAAQEQQFGEQGASEDSHRVDGDLSTV